MKLDSIESQRVEDYITEKVALVASFPLDDVVAKEQCLRATILDTSQDEFFDYLDKLNSLQPFEDIITTLKQLHNFAHNSPTFLPQQAVGAIARFLGSVQEYQDTQTNHAKAIAHDIIEKKADELRTSIKLREYRSKYQHWTTQLKTLAPNPCWRLQQNDLYANIFPTLDYPTHELVVKNLLLNTHYREARIALLASTKYRFNEIASLPLHQLFSILQNPDFISQEGSSLDTLQSIDDKNPLNPNQRKMVQQLFDFQLETLSDSEFLDDGTRFLYFRRALTENAASYYRYLDQIYDPNIPESQEALLAFKYIHDFLHNNDVCVYMGFKPAITAAGIHKLGSTAENTVDHLMGCTLIAAQCIEAALGKLQQNKELDKKIVARLNREKRTPQQACWRAFYHPEDAPGKVPQALQAPKCLPNYRNCLEQFGTEHAVFTQYKKLGPLSKIALFSHPEEAYKVCLALDTMPTREPHLEADTISDELVAACIENLLYLELMYNVSDIAGLQLYLTIDNNPKRYRLLDENKRYISELLSYSFKGCSMSLTRFIGYLPADLLQMLCERIKACYSDDKPYAPADFSPFTQTTHFNPEHSFQNFAHWLISTCIDNSAIDKLNKSDHSDLDSAQDALGFCSLCNQFSLDTLLALSSEKHTLFRTHARHIITLIKRFNCPPQGILEASTNTLETLFDTKNINHFKALLEHGASADLMLKLSDDQLVRVLPFSSTMIMLSRTHCPRNSRPPLSLNEQLKLPQQKLKPLLHLAYHGNIEDLTTRQVPLLSIISLTAEQLYLLDLYLGEATDINACVGNIARYIRTNTFSLSDIATLYKELKNEHLEDYLSFLKLLVEQDIPKSTVIALAIDGGTKQFYNNYKLNPETLEESIILLKKINTLISTTQKTVSKQTIYCLIRLHRTIKTWNQDNPSHLLELDSVLNALNDLETWYNTLLCFFYNTKIKPPINTNLLLWFLPENLPITQQYRNAGYSWNDLSILKNPTAIQLTLNHPGYVMSSMGMRSMGVIERVTRLIPKATLDTLIDVRKVAPAIGSDMTNLFCNEFKRLTEYAEAFDAPRSIKRLQTPEIRLLYFLHTKRTTLSSLACDGKLEPSDLKPLFTISKHIPLDTLLAYPDHIKRALLDTAKENIVPTHELPLIRLHKKGVDLYKLNWIPPALMSFFVCYNRVYCELTWMKLANLSEDKKTLIRIHAQKLLNLFDSGWLFPVDRIITTPINILRHVVRFPIYKYGFELLKKIGIITLVQLKPTIKLDYNTDDAFTRYLGVDIALAYKTKPMEQLANIFYEPTFHVNRLYEIPQYLDRLFKEDRSRLDLLIDNARAVVHLLKHNVTDKAHLIKGIPLEKLRHLLVTIQLMIYKRHEGLALHTQLLTQLAGRYHLYPNMGYEDLRKKRVKQWTLTACLTAILGTGSSVPAIVLPLAFAAAPLSSLASIALVSTAALIFTLTVLVTTLSSIEAHRCSKETYKKTFWPDREKHYRRVIGLDSNA